VSGQLHILADLPPGTQWIGDWLGLRTDLEDVMKRKFLPHWDSNSDLSVIQPIVSHYTNCATLAPFIYYMVALRFNYNIKYLKKYET
jgi:hypothetical protein